MHPTQHSTIPRPSALRLLTPTKEQRAISRLVQASAETLFQSGQRPHTQVRVIHPEPQDGRAA